ncbi:MAG: alpha/beta hydrolase [Rhodocyclaceae bacterium]|nr:alpha/beta hydrolase [Rhodocyclaceae bacterium]
MNQFPADDGEKIRVHVSGNGAPLVMLHGWTADHREWSSFLDALKPRRTIYAWDARGHGGHRLATTTVPSVARMARDLHNLIEHYGLDAVTVVGHSMGALTLWQYIRDFGTRRLAGVCIIDQSPKLVTDDGWPHGIYGDFGADKAAALLGMLWDDFAEGVLQMTAFGLNLRARQKYLENTVGWQRARAGLQALDPVPLIACWESLTAADYRDVLGSIDVPALLVYGAESNFYRTETAHYVASRIPASTLHIYAGADHSPHLAQRDRFVADLLEFCGG